MTWLQRLCWFVAGGIVIGISVLALLHAPTTTEAAVPKDGGESTVNFYFLNTLDHPVHVEINTSIQTFDLGEVGWNQTATKQASMATVGQGSISLIIKDPRRQVYPLGNVAYGKGPYQRFICLTPGGPVYYANSPEEGNWSGSSSAPYKEEAQQVGTQPAGSQPAGTQPAETQPAGTRSAE